MKKCILSAIVGAVCMLLVLYCIAAIRTPQAAEGYEHIDFVSDLSREDCFLCGSDARHWGEDNVGILNLNTFGLLRIEINRYDDRGQLISEPAGYLRIDRMQNVTSSATPDRGYAHVQITDIQYAIDKRMIQSKLCQACLDTVNSLSFLSSVPAEYAVVNFADRTIRPLIKCYPWFCAGNYDIDCEFKDNGTIDLLIHYCPPRYTETGAPH